MGVKLQDLASELQLDERALTQTLERTGVKVPEGVKRIPDKDAGRIRAYIFDQRKRAAKKQELITLPSVLTVRELSAKLALPIGEVISMLLKNGLVVTLNEQIDYETAAIIATDLGYQTAEDVASTEEGTLTPEKLWEILKKEDAAQRKPRPPVVTIMGHVDHGKCVHPETLIPLGNGALKVAKEIWEEYAPQGRRVASRYRDAEVVEVPVGPEFIAWDGEGFRHVRASHLWRLRAPSTLIELRLGSGDVLQITPEHPCLTFTSKGEFTYRPAAELQCGEFLVVPQTVPLGDTPLPSLKEEILRRLAAAGNFVVFLHPRRSASFVGRIRAANREALHREGLVSTRLLASTGFLRYRVGDLVRLAEHLDTPLAQLYDGIAGIKNANARWRVGHSSTMITLPRTSRDFAALGYLLGVIIGDGHLDTHEVSVHNNDREIQEASVRILRRVFGVRAWVGRGHTADMIHSGGYKSLVRFLHVVFDLPVGAKAGRVRIPSLVQQSRMMRHQTIAGLFDTDGFVSRQNHTGEFTSKSRALIRDVASLLLEEGVHATQFEKNGYSYLRIGNAPYLKRFFLHYPLRHRAKRKLLRMSVRVAKTSRIFDLTPLSGSFLRGIRVSGHVFPYFNAYKESRQLSRRMLVDLYGRAPEAFRQAFGATLLKPLVNPGEISLVRIAGVRRLRGVSHVYDFSIPRWKNFVAERTIIHNTTLLDAIRQASVASTEAGGITQAISGYQVRKKGKTITFIDTPGHEAFEFMRKRGASLSDFAILVVAADEGVKEQTREALRHAVEAEVPIIVALTKIDKPETNIDRVKRQLADAGVQLEEWGGQTPVATVSAKTGQGLDELLDTILVVNEVHPTTANPDRPALASVVEAHRDPQLGPLATVLIHTGTLPVGAHVVVGKTSGTIRRLLDFSGHPLREAKPSTPVTITGLADAPNAGDILQQVEARAAARAKVRQTVRSLPQVLAPKSVKLSKEEREARRARGRREPEKTGPVLLPIVLKADAQGSLEAIRDTLTAMSTPDVAVRLLRADVGGVTDSDVRTAETAHGIVLGFTVPVNPFAQKLADTANVSLRTFSVIYDLTEDVRKRLEALTPTEVIRTDIGELQVIKVFFSTRGRQIVGGAVRSGSVKKGVKVEARRGEEMIARGSVADLQENKVPVDDVRTGRECGITFLSEGKKVKEGDRLVFYTEETRKKSRRAVGKRQ